MDMQPCMDALVQQVVQADVHVSLDEIVSLGIVYVFSHVDLDPAWKFRDLMDCFIIASSESEGEDGIDLSTQFD